MKLEELRALFKRSNALWSDEIEFLFGHIDALSAVVERQREALLPFASIAATGFEGSLYEHGDESMQVVYHHGSEKAVTIGDFSRAFHVLTLTPATALRLHDAEVLEWCAKQYDQVPGREVFCSAIAQELRDHAAFIRSGKKAVDYGLCDGVCDD